MSWFTRKGQRVWGEGGYAAALTLHGWTPEEERPPIEGHARNGEPLDADQNGVIDSLEDVTVEVAHQAHADLTDDELTDVDTAIADETGPASTWGS